MFVEAIGKTETGWKILLPGHNLITYYQFLNFFYNSTNIYGIQMKFKHTRAGPRNYLKLTGALSVVSLHV